MTDHFMDDISDDMGKRANRGERRNTSEEERSGMAFAAAIWDIHCR